MAWRFHHDGEQYDELDVTLGQWGEMERLLEKSWHKIDPRFTAEDARVVLRVLISDRTGQDREAVGKTVDALPAREFIQLFKTVAEDLPEEYENGVPQ